MKAEGGPERGVIKTIFHQKWDETDIYFKIFARSLTAKCSNGVPWIGSQNRERIRVDKLVKS